MTDTAFPGAPTGVDLIGVERLRQLGVEGWTLDHDDHHDSCELSMAAAAYLWAAQLAVSLDMDGMTPEGWRPYCPDYWPWAIEFWKPSNDPIVNLAKAGALTAAEIDRLKRAAS
jgi:hypothetical protein